jgi:hypothetical protein
MSQWYYQNGQQKMGPLSQSDLTYYIRMGQVSPDGQVKGPGVDEWTRLGDVQDQITTPYAETAAEPWQGSAAMCIVLGLVSFAIGGYYLFIAPGVSDGSGTNIVNLQRLAIGITESIIGAIFVAAAIRPR